MDFGDKRSFNMKKSYNEIFKIAGDSLPEDKRLKKLTYETYLGLDEKDERRIAVDAYIKEAIDHPLKYKEVHSEIRRIRDVCDRKDYDAFNNFDTFMEFGNKLFSINNDKDKTSEQNKSVKEILKKAGIGQNTVDSKDNSVDVKKEKKSTKKEKNNKKIKHDIKGLISAPFKAVGKFNRKNADSVWYNLAKTGVCVGVAVLSGAIIASGGFPGFALANAITVAAMAAGAAGAVYMVPNTVSTIWDKIKNRKKTTIEEKTEQKEEENIEEKVEENIQEKEEEIIQEKEEENIQEKVEENIQEKEENKIVEKIEKEVSENNIQTDEESKLKENVDVVSRSTDAKETHQSKFDNVITPAQLESMLATLTLKEQSIKKTIAEIDSEIERIRFNNFNISEDELLNNKKYQNLLNEKRHEHEELNNLKNSMRAIRTVVTQQQTNYFKTAGKRVENNRDVTVNTNDGQTRTIYIADTPRYRHDFQKPVEYDNDSFGKKR